MENTLEPDDTKNITWENNHQRIMYALNDRMRMRSEPVPSITEIAKITGLSRQTIYQHIKEYSAHPAGQDSKELFGILQNEVIKQLCTEAMCGNIKAIRLFLEITGAIKAPERYNNLQINGLVLNRRTLQNLSDEQLKEIEGIIRPASDEKASY